MRHLHLPISMFKFIISILTLIPITQITFAQKNPYISNDSILKSHLTKDKYEIDGEASAIILYNKSNITLSYAREDYTELRECTIKLLTDNAIEELAHIALIFRGNPTLKKFVAITYNIENDQIIKDSVKSSNFLNEKYTEDINLKKLNFPNVKKGSIVHYSFIIEGITNYIFNDWYFETQYPTLHSEYHLYFPVYLSHTILERSKIPFVEADKVENIYNYEAGKFTEEISGKEKSITWYRKNIKGTKEESNMFDIDNFRDRIRLHINNITSGNLVLKLFPDWTYVTETYLYANKKNIGSVYETNGYLTKVIDSILLNKSSQIDIAKSLYSYVKNNFKSTNNEQYLPIDIRTTFNKKNGSPNNINALLCALLQKAGLLVQPLVGSKRNAEMLNAKYPNISDINYLICLLKIDNKDILLDASNENNPFGIIPPYCYNGYSRLVNKKVVQSTS
jgi:hypothetical protein